MAGVALFRTMLALLMPPRVLRTATICFSTPSVSRKALSMAAWETKVTELCVRALP